MNIAHIQDQIGPLVIRQVQLEEEVLRLEEQLGGNAINESQMIAIYGLRAALSERRVELVKVLDQLKEYRHDLIANYELEIMMIMGTGFFSDPVSAEANRQAVMLLGDEIQKLKTLV